MSRRLVVVGGGGHAREVLDVIEAVNAAAPDDPPWEVVGVVADGRVDDDLLARREVAVLGPVDRLADLDADHVIAIGAPAARREVDARLRHGPSRPAVLVHPLASIGADVELGPGTVLAAGARITTNVRLGRHVHLNVNAVVSHDGRVGDHVTLSPGCLVNGAVTIEAGAFVGTGAVITPGRRIGADAVVGAGAVVVRDVPAAVTARGVPARW